jgi:GTPase KRas
LFHFLIYIFNIFTKKYNIYFFKILRALLKTREEKNLFFLKLVTTCLCFGLVEMHVDYKIVVVGSAGVGKSALTIQFISNKFTDEYDPTIEDSYRKQMTVNEQICLLEVMDTAGTEDLQSYYINQGEGFVIVYSITNRRSFEAIDQLREQIINGKYSEAKTPIVVCGNKCDLKDAREVQLYEGNNKAKSYGCTFFETSARLRTNIEESFTALVKAMQEQAPSDDVGQGKKGQRGCVLL